MIPPRDVILCRIFYKRLWGFGRTWTFQERTERGKHLTQIGLMKKYPRAFTISALHAAGLKRNGKPLKRRGR